MWDWRMRESRPRIWPDEPRLAWVKEKAKGKSVDELKALIGAHPVGLALIYLLTGDEESARTAISTAVSYGDSSGWVYVTTAAVCYDWCYPVLTAAEKAKLRESFVRRFLYVQGDLVVVFDRVAARGSWFRKTWLLHSIIEPRLYGDERFEIAYNGGRLVCVPVLPEERSVRKVGGPGKEFLVGDARFACGLHASSGRKTPLNFGELPGAWRVEQSPIVPAEEHYFLNVMLMTDKESRAVPEVAREDTGNDTIAVSIALPYHRRVRVSFARGSKAGARLLIEERGLPLFDGDMPDRVVLEKGRI